MASLPSSLDAAKILLASAWADPALSRYADDNDGAMASHYLAVTGELLRSAGWDIEQRSVEVCDLPLVGHAHPSRPQFYMSRAYLVHGDQWLTMADREFFHDSHVVRLKTYTSADLAVEGAIGEARAETNRAQRPVAQWHHRLPDSTPIYINPKVMQHFKNLPTWQQLLTFRQQHDLDALLPMPSSNPTRSPRL